ncbi:hypothetical protein G7054_g10144 [Neopestalotiopsis clavispora]|nr:hypothetical protein G7054_g10144 [Neopestalotiopsis clavispora]
MIPTSSQQPRQIPGGPHPYTNAYFIVAPPQNACQEIPVSLDCYSFARSGQVYQLPRSASLRPNESMAANLESHQVLTSCHLDRGCKAWYVVDSTGQPGRPVQIFRTPVEPLPKSPLSVDLDLLNIGYDLGTIFLYLGDLSQAQVALELALEGFRWVLGSGHPHTMDALFNLGLTYERQGQIYRAGRAYSCAYGGYFHALGPSHSDTFRAAWRNGRFHQLYGDPARAYQFCRWAIHGYSDLLGHAHERVVYMVHVMALLCEHWGLLPEAQEYYWRALHSGGRFATSADSAKREIANGLARVRAARKQLAPPDQHDQPAEDDFLAYVDLTEHI